MLTFPLVSLIAMEKSRSLGLLGKEEADDEDVEHGKPEDEVGKVSERTIERYTNALLIS